MKTVDNFLFFRIGEVLKLLGITQMTLKNWYKWKNFVLERGNLTPEENRMVELLPEPITDWDNAGTRYFHSEDIEILKQFQSSVRYGLMAEYNKSRWGKRGQNMKGRFRKNRPNSV